MVLVIPVDAPMRFPARMPLAGCFLPLRLGRLPRLAKLLHSLLPSPLPSGQPSPLYSLLPCVQSRLLPRLLSSFQSSPVRKLLLGGLFSCLLSGQLLMPPLALAQQQQQQPQASCGRGAENDFDEERWKPADDGTVGDEQNGLMWKQCTEGLRGERCREGRLAYLTWEKALEIAEESTFAGFDDWRIPKLDELRQIIQPGCLLPVVNLALFPNTPSSWFWYDSAEDDNSPRAGQLGFAFGEDFSANQRNVVHLRLVREVPEEPADDAAQGGMPGQGRAGLAAGGAPPGAPGQPPAGQPDDVQAEPPTAAQPPGDNDQGQTAPDNDQGQLAPDNDQDQTAPDNDQAQAEETVPFG